MMVATNVITFLGLLIYMLAERVKTHIDVYQKTQSGRYLMRTGEKPGTTSSKPAEALGMKTTTHQDGAEHPLTRQSQPARHHLLQPSADAMQDTPRPGKQTANPALPNPGGQPAHHSHDRRRSSLSRRHPPCFASGRRPLPTAPAGTRLGLGLGLGGTPTRCHGVM